jgi:hypothetical protein
MVPLDSVIAKTEKTLMTENVEQIINFAGNSEKFFNSPLTFPAGRQSAIAYVDGVFDEGFCTNLIKHCEENSHYSKIGRTMGGTDFRIKVSTDWNLNVEANSPSEKELEFDRRIFEQIWKVINLYKETFPTLRHADSFDYCMVSDTGYQVQKYKQNSGFYNEHIDGAPWLGGSETRTLGLILYLNTVSEGGGTNFPFHQTTVDAVAGRVALFPSYWTHPHEGLMPLSSDKWIVSSFIRCIPPNALCSCPPPPETVLEGKEND